MNKREYQELLENPEYDFLRTNPHLDDRIVLLGLGGSHAYGTNIEGSDIDIRGVALPTKEEVLLGRPFEQVVNEDTDTTIYSFPRIVKLLTDANPNVLEMLFLNPEQYLYLSPYGELLIKNRELFISKKCFYTFGGYARQQLSRLENKTTRTASQEMQEKHILNSIINASNTFPEKYFAYPEDAISLYVDKSENEDMETEIFMDIHLKHYPLRDYRSMWSEMNAIVKSYSTLGHRQSSAMTHSKLNKHAMHLVRLMLYAVSILKTGTFSTYDEKNHDLYMDIRNGKYMEEDGQMSARFFAMVEELDAEMNAAFVASELPKAPNIKKIEKLLINVNKDIVEEE